MTNGWKVTAIVSIILLVLTWAVWVGLLMIGLNEIDRENICIVDICGDYDAYQLYENVCYCYLNNEIVHSEVMK